METGWRLESDLHFRHNIRMSHNGHQMYMLGTISADGKLIMEPDNSWLPTDYESLGGDLWRMMRIDGDSANTYSGGTEIVGRETGTTTPVRAVKSGALGKGNVVLANSARLMIEADDVINPGATLDLSPEALVYIGGGVIQSGIVVYHDGEIVPEGTYTGGDFPWLIGSGTLNVIGPVVAGFEVPWSAGFVRMDLQPDSWQLVGLPFNQVADERVALADVLGTVGFVNGAEVMAWDGTGYAASSFFLGTWSGNLELRRGQGFWIKSPVDMDLYLLGQVPGEADTAINLSQGLQLISAPYSAAIDLNDGDVLLSVPINGDQIFFIGDGPGYTANAYFMGTWSGAGMLEPGKGYCGMIPLTNRRC